MASEKTMKFIEDIKALSVLELAELVEAIQEEFGVTAVVAAAGPAAGAGAGAAEAEKTEFDIVLKSFGDGKMNVIDIDELCEAKEKLLINDQQFFISVKQLGALIKLIQDGNFSSLTDRLKEHI